MRSRPRVELTSSPGTPRAGDWVTFRVTLIGRSDTPIEAIHFHYRTIETRLTREAAWRTAKNQVSHCRFERALSTAGFLLARHESRDVTFEVQLPADLPPSWRSEVSSVVHEVEVRVVIPRWFDRTGVFDLMVVPAPTDKAQRAVLCSGALEGKRGTELSLELALESAVVECGGQVRGAVALMNTVHHRAARLEVSLVLRDAPVGPSRLGAKELFRSAPEVLTGDPEEGRAYPFALGLPTALPPSFVGTVVALEWRLEARAVVRRSHDLVVASNLEVFTSGRAEPAPLPSLRVAPVGHERRALAWTGVAERSGLTATKETMAGRRGAVALELALALRGDRVHAVATLRWPAAGLGVRVVERRWSDALAKGVLTGDECFDERFFVQGRDPSQVRAFLRDDVRRALLAVDHLTLDDVGAVLASPGNADEQLEPRVRAAVVAAEALDAALQFVPAPAPLAPCREAWAAQAAKLGGTFCAGDFSLRGARHRHHDVELLTCFDDAGCPTHTLARVLGAASTPLSEQAQRAFASVAAECEGLNRTDAGWEARLPSPLADPQRAEPLWRALARLATLARGA